MGFEKAVLALKFRRSWTNEKSAGALGCRVVVIYGKTDFES